MTGPIDDTDCYTPESIRFWLARWSMLTTATQGGTGSSGQGAGRGDRLALACVKADLESAADRLPLYWQSTEYVFGRQRRGQVLQQRRQNTPPTPDDLREPEHPVPSAALDEALYRMARSLGWTPVAEPAA